MKLHHIALPAVLILNMLLVTACNKFDGTHESLNNGVQEKISHETEEAKGNMLTETRNKDTIANSIILEHTNLAIKYESISEVEYKEWVVASYDGYLDTDKIQYELPDISSFDYPVIVGLEDESLQQRINETIKESIFDDFIALDERFVERLVYEDDFYVDPNGEIEDFFNNYFKVKTKSKEEVINSVLDALRMSSLWSHDCNCSYFYNL